MMDEITFQLRPSELCCDSYPSYGFKSGLCNQLFFPVNEFPAPCNHPNFLGEFVQADGWARLPVTPLNPGSGKLRRTFLMSRSPHGSSRFEFRIPPEKSRRLVIPRTSCWRCSRTLVRAAARPSARQLCRSRRSGRCQHPRFPCLPSPSSARVQKPDRRRWRLV